VPAQFAGATFASDERGSGRTSRAARAFSSAAHTRSRRSAILDERSLMSLCALGRSHLRVTARLSSAVSTFRLKIRVCSIYRKGIGNECRHLRLDFEEHA
jgi:hypothetical protein